MASTALFFLGGWSSGYQPDSKQLMKSIDFHAAVSENGNVRVTEVWNVSLGSRDKPYRNFYRTFKTGDVQAGAISDLSVYDADLGTSYTFAGDIDPESISDDSLARQCYIHKMSDGTEIGWFMPGIRKGTRTFRVSYTIQQLVHTYGDAAEFYYKFLPDNFSMPVEALKGTIQLPDGAVKNDLRAWLHTDADGELTINSGSQVSFSSEKIPKNTFVEVRLLTPTSLFPAAPKAGTQNVLSSIEQQEMTKAKESQNRQIAEQERQRRLGLFDVASAASVLAVSIMILALVKVKNKRVPVQVPEYTHDVPKGNSPAGIANLYYFYGGAGEETKRNRIFSSTMLSLARKGHLHFGSEDAQITISIPPSGHIQTVSMTESEQAFYKILVPVAESFGGTFTMKQFKKYAKKHYESLDFQISNFFLVSKHEILSRKYFRTTRKKLLGFLTVLGTVMILSSFVALGITGSSDSLLIYLPLSLIAGGILLNIAGRSHPKLTEKGEYDLAVWRGLKKYMLEFSRMKEYSVPELPLWEEYLVYATMMGISEKVCKQLKLVYPQISSSSYWEANPSYSYLPFFFWGPSRSFADRAPAADYDFGSALGHAMTDIGNAATRLAHPNYSSSKGGNFGGGGFGGGGFSGGGGGFGGGGGGVR